MPIAVKDYKWEDSFEYIDIFVPLKGAKACKVNIFSTEHYLKVNYPPYFFECLLYAPVSDNHSKATISDGVVIFNLKKQEPGEWDQLHSPESADKELMKIRREEAIKRAQERSEEEAKKKVDKKRENEKYALKEAMKLEQDEKERIADRKEDERKKATDELEAWKIEQKQKAELEREQLRIEREKERYKLEDIVKSERSKNKKNIFELEDGQPGTREVGKIDVKFTPRVFPTAARESQAQNEEEWLKKQADMRKIIETEDKDLSEEEKNPQWLKDKGDSFFKTGNYQAAINAYSQAIRLGSQMPSLFSNRAACHLKLGNLMKCAEDSSKALDNFVPAVQQNAAGRLKAHIRRGTAFCNLELYVEGLMDYEAALKIDPNNVELQKDADEIRRIIQSSDDT